MPAAQGVGGVTKEKPRRPHKRAAGTTRSLSRQKWSVSVQRCRVWSINALDTARTGPDCNTPEMMDSEKAAKKPPVGRQQICSIENTRNV